WDSRDRRHRQLTRVGYEAMGGVAGTLAGHADAVLAAMTANRLGLARAVLERLVTPEQTRALVTLDELSQLPGDCAAIEQVVRVLADSRLIAIEDSGERDSATVELIHESLITRWPTLRRWLDENRDDAEFLARLRAASKEWERSGRSEGTLWRGEVAEGAWRWHEQYNGELGERERRYLAAVVALARRAERTRRRLLYGAMAGLVALLGVAVVAVVQSQAVIAQQKQELQLTQELKDAVEQAELARRAAVQEKERAEREKVRAKRALTDAERVRAAMEQEKKKAERARAEAQDEAARARAAEARAKDSATAAQAAESRARAAQQQAEESAGQERAARKKLQQIIERANGGTMRKGIDQ
ncbi:MAG: serine/threonine-protein kinase PknK, partial [Myxococcota bacterium]